ncbi:epidermal growth factor receptor kinase substrate 8-like protein 3b [Aplochiton taeniatus]
MSRPTGKSIYMQRKEYSESVNKQPDNFQYRVEHLFTCEQDGQEVRSLDDCVTRLKRLDAKGRVWGQEMVMEVQRGNLLLTDIETKAELESLPLSSILQTKAVLDSCAYNSLLTVTVQEPNKHFTQVFMFQCEEVGAEHIRSDLAKVIQNRGPNVEPRREHFEMSNQIRNNLENIIAQQLPGSFKQPGPPPVQQRERTPPPPDQPAPQWNSREQENISTAPFYHTQDAPPNSSDVYGSQLRQEGPPQPPITDTDRNVDILNHVLNDVEIFMGQVAIAVPNYSDQKNKKKKKSSKKLTAPNSLPHWDEYVSCLQKVKYGFNLLGKLNLKLSNPSAPDFVHILFSTLGMLVPQYPEDLPSTVISPLLTEPALHLLSQVISAEDQLWRSLGDSWNVPRSRWPNGDMIPPYIPEFYDGWQPPAPPSSQSQSLRRSNSQYLAPGSQNGPNHHSRDTQWQAEEPLVNNSWGSPPPACEPLLYMRVIYDFMARNPLELSVMKGDVVQVVDKSKQWWRVRNGREEEGHVPQNVLEPMNGGEMMDDYQDKQGPPPLDMMSRPADVKAWLQYKGFSKLTIRSLGVLNGQLLLGMSRDDIRTVCPEEGSKVFFQLQSIKSSIALASESAYGPYNGR